MKDSKLKSEDLIRIRKGLGGGAKATTQTARIARKLAAKTTKRNKITVSVKKIDEGEHQFGMDTRHKITLKKGGVPKVKGYMTFEKGLIPDPDMPDGGGWARADRRVMADLHKRTPSGKAVRGPASLSLTGITPAGVKVRPLEGVSWEDTHKKYANKTMKPNDLKRGLQEIGKKFPTATKVSGWRITGRRDKLVKAFDKPLPIVNANGRQWEGLNAQSTINLRTARVALPKIEAPKSIIDTVRRNAAKLKGAMRGVNKPRVGFSAPLEAAFTSYTTGGGTTGAATAAASTAGAGAGVGAILKKVGGAVVKAAPILGKVGARAVPGLMLATGAYDVGRVAYEGYKAHEAASDARKNEASMNERYGTVEAATQTRHANDRKRAKKAVEKKNSNLKQGYLLK